MTVDSNGCWDAKMVTMLRGITLYITPVKDTFGEQCSLEINT